MPRRLVSGPWGWRYGLRERFRDGLGWRTGLEIGNTAAFGTPKTGASLTTWARVGLTELTMGPTAEVTGDHIDARNKHCNPDLQ